MEINTRDLAEIKKQFSALDQKIRKKVFVKVLKNNTRVLESKMKELAPVSTSGTSGNKRYPKRNHPPGYLRATIGTIVSKRGDYPTIWVRPRFKGRWDPWYEHFPMAGTKNYNVEPDPFVDKAWEQVGESVQTGLVTDLEKQIQAVIDKIK